MKHFLTVVALTMFGQSLAAQQLQLSASDPVPEAPVRLGPLGIAPKVSLTSLGWDNNVFNESGEPKSDFTFSVTPAADVWARTGRGLLTVAAAADFVYFATYESQRSINSRATGQYEYGFNRIRPYVSARTLNTRDQPGFEIEARVRHYETEFQSGVDFRVGPKTNARLNFKHIHYTFAGDEVYNGRPLNEELNRTLRGVNVDWRQRLTALTTWVFRASAENERFEFDDLRNSDSLRILTGFELARFALIRGNAFVGYRRLTPAAGGLFPEYSGLIADVNVAYTGPFDTRWSANVTRDVQYSYENRTPYYVQTSWTAALTKRVVGRWDVQFTGGQDHLGYRFIVSTIDARSDVVGRFGGGIGYNIGEGLRFGFDVNSFYRRSVIAEREFGAVRGGFSVTYVY